MEGNDCGAGKMALQDVTAMVLRQTFLLAAFGLGIGIAMSLLTRQVLATEVFGIHFLDFPVYLSVTLLLATVALAAAHFRHDAPRRPTNADSPNGVIGCGIDGPSARSQSKIVRCR